MHTQLCKDTHIIQTLCCKTKMLGRLWSAISGIWATGFVFDDNLNAVEEDVMTPQSKRSRKTEPFRGMSPGFLCPVTSIPPTSPTTWYNSTVPTHQVTTNNDHGNLECHCTDHGYDNFLSKRQRQRSHSHSSSTSASSFDHFLQFPSTEQSQSLATPTPAEMDCVPLPLKVEPTQIAIPITEYAPTIADETSTTLMEPMMLDKTPSTGVKRKYSRTSSKSKTSTPVKKCDADDVHPTPPELDTWHQIAFPKTPSSSSSSAPRHHNEITLSMPITGYTPPPPLPTPYVEEEESDNHDTDQHKLIPLILSNYTHPISPQKKSKCFPFTRSQRKKNKKQ